MFAVNEQITITIQNFTIHVSLAKHYKKVKEIKILGRSSMFSDTLK
jgi:hypothetical protein